jgi:hypothetical protein
MRQPCLYGAALLTEFGESDVISRQPLSGLKERLMKKFPSVLFRHTLLAIAAVWIHTTSAQTFPVSVVTIRAPDPIAAESGDTATFEVDRQGPTNSALNVYYDVLGTASNGVDYAEISHFAFIAAGTRSAQIVIKPIQNGIVGGAKTVILQFAPSPLMTPLIPVNYMTGTPSNALAYIFEDGSNSPPPIAIISPPDGSSFSAPANIPLLAKTFDPAGAVSNVEFFAGSADLGRGNLLVLDPPGISGIVGVVYYLNWTNVPPGKYSVTAVANSSEGSSTSAPVVVKVNPPPPIVAITSPANGATFTAPVDIPVTADASSSNADVVRVDFFADDHFIGSDRGTNKSPYSITWSNAPPGFYFLRAVAIDSFGSKGVSDLVRISVTGTIRPPPGPVVTIYALDPVAVVGTNCLNCYSNSPVAGNWNFRSVTNTASFVVRRSGATNGALDVYYDVSGTASNSEDYVNLPGIVTIPAGFRAARIVINPLNEGGPECPETVVLSLQQPTNTPPPYFAGWPDRAAAVIVDCNFAPPATALMCNGVFHFFFPPVTAAPYYRLECSSDMQHWLPICTNAASQLGIHFTDPQSPNFPNLFYRTTPVTNAPLDYP